MNLRLMFIVYMKAETLIEKRKTIYCDVKLEIMPFFLMVELFFLKKIGRIINQLSFCLSLTQPRHPQSWKKLYYIVF